MSFYREFPVTPARALDVDSLLNQLRATDPTIGIQAMPGAIDGLTIKKATEFTEPQIPEIQAAIDATPTLTDARAAVHVIDNWPPDMNALVFVIVDQLNVIRAALVPPLPPLPYPAVFAAIKQKADPV